jgi:hypothetical protein
MTRADAVPLDSQGKVRAETDGLTRALRVGDMTAIDRRPLRGSPAVVERRLADQFHLDVAFEALDRPDQHVVGVVVGRRPRVRCDFVLMVPRPDRQRVSDDEPARGRLPGRLQHVRARLVDPRRRVVDSVGPEPERSRLPVEQASEHAWGVKGRDAEPVDRTIRRHQRPRVAVGQKCVLGDRRKRRRCRRALHLPRRAWRALGC